MGESEATKFENLTIQSNFMFKHVMGNKSLCQYFISNVMQCDVVGLEYIETEKELEPYFDSKCVRLKQDKEVRRKYMVLQAELRDTEIVAFEAGEAKGRAEGLAVGEAKGEFKKSRETALEMLKDKQPLSFILKYSTLAEKEVYALAKENGLEVVVG